MPPPSPVPVDNRCPGVQPSIEVADGRAHDALLLVPDAVVSHTAAAAVLGLPGFPVYATVCLSRPPGGGHRRRLEPGRVHVHTADLAGDTVVVRGLPVTGAARTVCDVARERDPADALALADACLRAGLVTAADLVAVLARQQRWPGRRGAVRVLAAADPGAAGPGESRVRAALVLTGPLDHPLVGEPAGGPMLVGVPVTGASGRPRRGALVWPDQRVVVQVGPGAGASVDDAGPPESPEAPGPRGSPGRVLPLAADEDLRAGGWSVLRVGADADRDPAALASRLRPLLTGSGRGPAGSGRC